MMINSWAALPLQKLKRAVGIREQIESLTLELNQLLSGRGTTPGKGRRILSAAGRERIAAAQRLRWSKFNSGRPRRMDLTLRKERLSPEGRARVAAAVRARWNRFRAAKARALSVK